MSDAAWSNWSEGTIEGHADELAVLQEHAPGASLAEACMSDGAPAVIAYEAPRLVVVRSGRFARLPVWSTGRVEVRVDGPSATIAAGALNATFVPIPFALSVQVLANAESMFD